MSKKKTFRLKTAAGLAAAALAVGGAILWVSFGNGPKMPVPAYKVTKVVDGDTFFTNGNLMVRLADIDAPEIGRCGSAEAFSELKKLVNGKTVYLVTKRIDRFNRDDSLVYTKDGSVNLAMIKKGLAVYSTTQNTVPEFKAAGNEARKAKRGIFGPKCTQLVNPKNPTCNIKGNINDSMGTGIKQKYYFYPECRGYERTVVELYKGDQWFCLEAEAKKAGFTKPKVCQ